MINAKAISGRTNGAATSHGQEKPNIVPVDHLNTLHHFRFDNGCISQGTCRWDFAPPLCVDEHSTEEIIQAMSAVC
ncbi:hypothetical protein [Methylobacterium sp. J-026]|uniref:hypothetical protein n=1 Tax=Methylobacterium sp. J-026 TaxID=2836624 RepID=UPI001FB9A13A|nr:hypothetical protein [Methylobacterium sp. J-026]